MSSVSVLFGDPMPLSAVIASNIRAEAARKGWRQKDLARALGVTPTTISRKWLGLRLWQVDELEEVAEVLDVTVQDLVRRARRDSNPQPADLESVQDALPFDDGPDAVVIPFPQAAAS